MDGSPDSLRWINAHEHFFTHLRIMPSWHKLVVLLGGLVAVLGTVGQIASPSPTDPGVPTNQPPAQSWSHERDAVADRSSAEAPDPAWSISRISPHARRVGLSIVLGFVIGWLFRAFLRTMAVIAILVGGVVWLLAHFNVLHITDDQIESLREKSTEAAGWLGVQATHLKGILIAHLPSTGGGAFGAYLGLQRR